MPGANAHLTAGVERRGSAPADASVVVVAVHGRGQSPEYLVEHLIERIDDELIDGLAVAWLLPAADSNTWYPNGFLAPIADNQPSLDHALAALAAIEEELAPIDPQRVVWAGFSQGACLVSEFVARNPKRWGGLLALTGGMIGPPGTSLAISGDFEGMPAYFTDGDADDWVPTWRVEETAEAYRDANADVTMRVFTGRVHEICDDEIDHTSALLAAVAAR